MDIVKSPVYNVMTVDVEDYFHVQAFFGVIDRDQWDRYPMRVEQNTRRLLEIFCKYDVRATFFILGWVADRCAKLVREIADAGHEVGCHGYAHQPIYNGNAKEFRQDVRHALAIVQSILGTRVRSYRAPSYSITKDTIWALDVLGEEGFEFDSSIFPVVHDNYGIRDAARFPHVRKLNHSGYITEFPPSTVRLLGNNIPVAGGGYLRLYPYRVTSWAIKYLNKKENQPAMVYLHPWELDKEQPRIPACWRSRFRHYQNIGTMESKLENLLVDFAWKPMGDVLRQSALGVC